MQDCQVWMRSIPDRFHLLGNDLGRSGWSVVSSSNTAIKDPLVKKPKAFLLPSNRNGIIRVD